MGSTCGADAMEDYSPFDWKYGEDDNEVMIKHEDEIPCSVDFLRPTLDEAARRLRESEKRFRDTLFSTENIVLTTGGTEIHCTFQRPETFLKKDEDLKNKKYRIVSRENCKASNIVVEDEMMQYFGVLLCFLAEHSELIEKIILTGTNSYGLAAVYVVHEGRRRVVYLDDYILCRDGKPIFSQPIQNTDMWPCLLEKAWFKARGFWKRGIEKTHPFDLFRTFLNFPMKPIAMEGDSERTRELARLHLIDRFLNRNTVGAVVTTKLKPEHKIGLSGRQHLYLARIFEVAGKIYYLMRNPCPKDFHFRGVMRMQGIDEDLMRLIMKVTGEYPTGGDFLLTEQEFQEQIESFFVVNYTPLAPLVTEKPVRFNKDNECFLKFQINHDQPMGLRFYQLLKLKRFSPVTAQLLDLDRQSIAAGLHNEEGCFGLEEANLLNTPLQTMMPGTYLLRLKVKPLKEEDDANTNILDALLSKDMLIANASEEINFEAGEEGQVKAEFYELLKAIARKKFEEGEGIHDEDGIEHVLLWLGDLVVIYIRRLNSAKDSVNMEVNFPDLLNLECITHPLKKGYSSFPPLQNEALIIFEKVVLTEETLLGHYSLVPY